MLFFTSFSLFVAMPDRKDALLSKSSTLPHVTASGSLGLDRDVDKCVPTSPNKTLNDNEEEDWCSNIPSNKEDCPWISYEIPGKGFKLTGYSIRTGCCYYHCCCDPTTGHFFDGDCCCRLKVFSLQGSNDNHTWKVIHQYHNDDEIIPECELKTFEFAKTESFKHVRFVLDKEVDGCYKCMQINQIEFYGETISDYSNDFLEPEEFDESVSIIGKIQRN